MNVLEVMMHFMWSRVALMSGRECEEGSQPTWRNVAWMQPKRVRQRFVLSHVSAMLICVSVTSSRIILSAGDQRERWCFRVSVFVRLLVIFYLLTESLSVWSFTPTSCFRFHRVSLSAVSHWSRVAGENQTGFLTFAASWQKGGAFIGKNSSTCRWNKLC